MVEKTAGLAAEYDKGDIEEMWKFDAQCPMGHMGDAWDVAYACLYLASDASKESVAIVNYHFTRNLNDFRCNS
jgi:NAD(P)-dependent dehydrogenase (short-subunit alcohol dehydrogenase family)